MLNKTLWQVLQRRFGEVKTVSEGVSRIEEKNGYGRVSVVEPGESYSLNCPFCGDKRQRLSISYKWLTTNKWTGETYRHLIHCYNESCEQVYSKEFQESILEDINLARLGVLPNIVEPPETVEASWPPVRNTLRFPDGVALNRLSSEHPALVFLRNKYPGLMERSDIIECLSRNYEAYFVDTPDPFYPKAENRIIFPIRNLRGDLAAWQGRTIDSQSSDRWYNPPGSQRMLYNGHKVLPVHTPVICEGIASSIACGDKAVALLGKEMSGGMLREFVAKWRSAVIALDPETFVPDNRHGCRGVVYAEKLYKQLKRHIGDVRMVKYPDSVLDIACRHNNGEKIGVPDPADLGFSVMKSLLG